MVIDPCDIHLPREETWSHLFAALPAKETETTSGWRTVEVDSSGNPRRYDRGSLRSGTLFDLFSYISPPYKQCHHGL